MSLTYSMLRRFNMILEALADGTKTSNELAAETHMGTSSIGNVLLPMLKKGYIARKRVEGQTRRFTYVRLVNEVAMEELVGTSKEEAPTPSYVRVINFDTDEMKAKLIAQDQQYRKDRKRKPVYISSNWNNV